MGVEKMRVEIELKNGKIKEIENVYKTFNGRSVTLISVVGKIKQIEYNTNEIKYMHTWGN